MLKSQFKLAFAIVKPSLNIFRADSFQSRFPLIAMANIAIGITALIICTYFVEDQIIQMREDGYADIPEIRVEFWRDKVVDEAALIELIKETLPQAEAIAAGITIRSNIANYIGFYSVLNDCTITDEVIFSKRHCDLLLFNFDELLKVVNWDDNITFENNLSYFADFSDTLRLRMSMRPRFFELLPEDTIEAQGFLVGSELLSRMGLNVPDLATPEFLYLPTLLNNSKAAYGDVSARMVSIHGSLENSIFGDISTFRDHGLVPDSLVNEVWIKIPSKYSIEQLNKFRDDLHGSIKEKFKDTLCIVTSEEDDNRAVKLAIEKMKSYRLYFVLIIIAWTIINSLFSLHSITQSYYTEVAFMRSIGFTAISSSGTISCILLIIGLLGSILGTIVPLIVVLIPNIFNEFTTQFILSTIFKYSIGLSFFITVLSIITTTVKLSLMSTVDIITTYTK
ncbi:hypothetical protein K8I28_10275 [bacterium]|nr:hypothetical protein [bacterium]